MKYITIISFLLLSACKVTHNHYYEPTKSKKVAYEFGHDYVHPNIYQHHDTTFSLHCPNCIDPNRPK